MVNIRKLLAVVSAALLFCSMSISFADAADDPVAATAPTKGVINVVQLDRYAGTIGKHPIMVFLGNTDREIIGQYNYGKVVKGGNDALSLTGSKDKSGKWELRESTVPADHATKPQQTGRWVLEASANDWLGTWSKPDGSGALAVTLHKELEAADYAILSRVDVVADVVATRADAPECTIRIYRHQKVAEIIDGSNDGEVGCERAQLEFPDLNFDGHADMINNIDTPGHNTSYNLMLYDEASQRFVSAGMMAEPQVDPVHKNIFNSIHYSCCAHSAAIYRIKKGELTLIKEMQPCSYREPKDKAKDGSCFENYGYDLKTGKIVEGDE